MSEDRGVVGFMDRKPHRGLAALKESDKGGDEASCPAFGYAWGLDQRALAVEFRFRDGNSEWFAYSLLGRGGTTRRSDCCSNSRVVT